MNRLLTIVDSKYQRLEYLQSDGNAYIDTGIILGDNFEVEVEFVGVANGTDKPVFSSRESSGHSELSCFAPGGTAGRIQIKYGSANNNLSARTINNTLFNIKTNGLNWYVNGELVYSFTDTTTLTQPLYISAVKNEGATSPNFVGQHKIRFMKVKKNGSMIATFVPVLRKTDNELGMLDLVEGKFYPNAGTGDFLGA